MSDSQKNEIQLKTTVVQKVIKSDTFNVIESSSDISESTEVFTYDTTTGAGLALKPPFPPTTLQKLPQLNNTLLQCIEAMEVNIDGTGHEFVPLNDDIEMDEKEIQIATDFFNEPFPQTGFMPIRRELRRNVESTGNAYLEVITNISGEVLGLRSLNPRWVRLGPLSAATTLTKKMTRGGKELDFTYFGRERCFVYSPVMGTHLYFNEFGNTQTLHNKSGAWTEAGSTLDNPSDTAGFIIHMKMNDDVFSDYGVPRWVNQMPSVLGSRKAEEQNLEFFDAGGIPSAIVFVKGGTLAVGSSEQLKNYLEGKGKTKGRAVVVEAISTSGSLDSAGSVDISVERFGSETQKDSLYANYDKACEEHVRLAFRLPPLFIGKAQDYNYATASVAYQVAEAQVFKPERDDFDDLINRTIMKALGFKTIKFRSNPLTIKDIANQLKALELLIPVVEAKDIVDEVNTLTDINLPYKEGAQFPATKSGIFNPSVNPLGQPNAQQPVVQPEPVKPQTEAETADVVGNQTATGANGTKKKQAGLSSLELLQLVKQYGESMELIPSDNQYTTDQVQLIAHKMKSLSPEEKEASDKMMSLFVFGTDGMLEGCCGGSH